MSSEREMIIAWLRGLGESTEKLTRRELNSRAFAELTATVNRLANAIERGDHLKEQQQ
jgi:hypothetical protein